MVLPVTSAMEFHPEELFWGLLVYTPHFYHLLHWLREFMVLGKVLKPHFSCPSSWSCIIFATYCPFSALRNCPRSNRREHGWESSPLGVQSLRSGMILPPTASLPSLKGSLPRYDQDKDSRLLLGDVIVIVVIITHLIIIISSAGAGLLWRTYAYRVIHLMAECLYFFDQHLPISSPSSSPLLLCFWVQLFFFQIEV